jgi:anti-sigma regulatory factor (Ser/Thr protein kinase)
MATSTSVGKEELAKELAERARLSEGDARALVDHFCAILRARIAGGERIELEDLLAIAAAGSPEVREDESGGFSPYAPKNRKLVVKALGNFRGELERSRPLTIYYVALSTEGRFLDLLADYFGRRGWRLQNAKNAMEVQTRLENQPPAAVLFESRSEGWQELLRELKCNPKTNNVPVVGIYPASARDEAPVTLQIEPDGVIYEPFDFGEFVKTAGSELAARIASPSEDTLRVAIAIPGSQRERQAARTLVGEVLFRAKLPEAFISDTSAALGEALDNALRHGHRGIECCAISAQVILDPRRLVVAVRDTGAGFDHAAVLTAARASRKRTDGGESDALLRAADALRTRRGSEAREGGIAQMLRWMDRVEFNRQGNEVVLTKFRPSAR